MDGRCGSCARTAVVTGDEDNALSMAQNAGYYVSRAAAYAASMLLFSVYHIWGYAAADPTAWLYLLQYLPASFLLARIYEKTNTLWASIFLHMTVNGVAMMAISALGKLL